MLCDDEFSDMPNNVCSLSSYMQCNAYAKWCHPANRALSYLDQQLILLFTPLALPLWRHVIPPMRGNLWSASSSDRTFIVWVTGEIPILDGTFIVWVTGGIPILAAQSSYILVDCHSFSLLCQVCKQIAVLPMIHQDGPMSMQPASATATDSNLESLFTCLQWCNLLLRITLHCICSAQTSFLMHLYAPA